MPGWLRSLLSILAAVGLTLEQVNCIRRTSENYAESRSNGFERFEQETVIPVEIREAGHPHYRFKRETGSGKDIYFRGFGEDFHLELRPVQQLLAPGFRVYHLGRPTAPADKSACQFRGILKNQPNSGVALNLCGGMSGLLKTSKGEYLIEPARIDSSHSTDVARPHLLRKRSVQRPRVGSYEAKDQSYFCGRRRRYMPHKPRRKDHWLPGEFAVPDKTVNSHNRTKRWIQEMDYAKAASQKSTNRRSVETLVVADRELVRKHGTENVTNYLLTIFNMVAMLYQDSTIGNNVSVSLVGLVLLEGDEPGLSLSHNAENSLSSFCQWQSAIHTSKGRQHDHAVLVTGMDICSWKDAPCDTLGYAPISGMCSKYRSCTINEDSGLALAFTVAHEIGHNFGMVHDGQGSSPCRRKRGTIMSASLSGLDTSLLWSDCSRRDLAKFLE